MIILLEVITAHIVLWLCWVPASYLLDYSKHDNPVIAWTVKIILAPFVVVDVYVNLIPSTILFFQIPPTGGWSMIKRQPERLTLTWRMSYNIAYDETWRADLSEWICKYLVEPWDHGHCRLNK